MKARLIARFVGDVEFVVEVADPDDVHTMIGTIIDQAKPVADGKPAKMKCTGVSFVEWADEDARLSTYTCAHCGAQSLKELWGPGRITCPQCKKIAPSAAESASFLPPR